MWWFFFIIFLLISLFSTIALFYALKRINQYENLITQIQQIIQFSAERMKVVDSKGTFESDDEVGFFFKEIKEIQSILNEIFETGETEDAKKEK